MLIPATRPLSTQLRATESVKEAMRVRSVVCASAAVAVKVSARVMGMIGVRKRGRYCPAQFAAIAALWCVGAPLLGWAPRRGTAEVRWREPRFRLVQPCARKQI